MYYDERFDKIYRHIEEHAEEEFSRSGGPGGQHVNKTSSKVTLRIPIAVLPLPPEERNRVEEALSGRITTEGDLIIHSSETRSQAGNRQRAYERAASLIASAAAPPKKRKKTKPSRAAKERRLEKKRKRGEKKRLRKPPGTE